MRGFVTRKGNAWYAVTELSRDASTGRRRKKWHSGFRTRREAETALVDILSRMQQGLYVGPSKKSLGEFLEEWLATVRPTVRASTWSSYCAEIRKHVLPHLGATRLQAIGPGDLNSLYAQLLTSGRQDGKGGLSARTVRYIHTILRRALETAVRWNLIPRNPASIADPPRASGRQHEMRTWSAEQVRTFLESTSEERLHAAWVLLATTGMRRGEVLGLRWSDVDFEHRRVSVNRSLISVDYEIRFESPKTARSRRSVALDSGTVTRLREHRRTQIEERLALGTGFDHDGLLFCQPDGLPVHPDRFMKLFQRTVSKAGLPRIRLHDLRHTFATLALEAGVHPKVVSDRLGHSSIAITLDTYSHVAPSLDAAAAEVVAGAILRPTSAEPTEATPSS